MILLLLAAGMGSRYGGLKQLDTFGKHGETLMEYSVYDALRSGFDKVVFVIRSDMEQHFRVRFGCIAQTCSDIYYVFQSRQAQHSCLDLSAERDKPWGTVHALLAAHEVIDRPFVVANADDFYGRSAYLQMAAFLSALVPAPETGDYGTTYGMVGYGLQKVLSAFGTVARGICQLDEQGYLQSIRELSNIVQTPQDGIVARDTGETLLPDMLTSMNFWGFTPAIFGQMRVLFDDFLEQNANDSKAECVLSSSVNSLLRQQACRISVMPSEEQWLGVTYQADKPRTEAALLQLIAKGNYPDKLW